MLSAHRSAVHLQDIAAVDGILATATRLGSHKGNGESEKNANGNKFNTANADNEVDFADYLVHFWRCCVMEFQLQSAGPGIGTRQAVRPSWLPRRAP